MASTVNGNLKIGNKYYVNAKVNGNTIFDNPSTPVNHNAYGGSTVPTGKLSDSRVEKIYGDTQKWNQLVRNGNFESTSNWAQHLCTISSSNNILTVTKGSGADAFIYQDGVAINNNHKFYIRAEVNPSVTGVAFSFPYWDSIYATWSNLTSNKWNVCDVIPSKIATRDRIAMYFNKSGNDGITYLVRNVIIVDLTALYGAGNEPSTVAAFLSDHPEYSTYVPYNAGAMANATISKVESVGVNLWDTAEWVRELKTATGEASFPTTTGNDGTYDYVRVTVQGGHRGIHFMDGKFNKNTQYHFSWVGKRTSKASSGLEFIYTDGTGVSVFHRSNSWENYSYTSASNKTLRYIIIAFADYDYNYFANIQCCLNTVPDKTTYHPYTHDELVLPSTVTLRSAGSVKDEYNPETGVITRRVGTQSITGAVGDTITLNGCSTSATTYICGKGDIGTLSNGVITLSVAVTSEAVNYELLAPTTESVTPITPIISTEGNGTVSLTHSESPATKSVFDMKYWNLYGGAE